MSSEKVYPENYFRRNVTRLIDGGVARKDICEKLDISKGYLSGILSGKKAEPDETVIRLLDAVYPENKPEPCGGAIEVPHPHSARPELDEDLLKEAIKHAMENSAEYVSQVAQAYYWGVKRGQEKRDREDSGDNHPGKLALLTKRVKVNGR